MKKEEDIRDEALMEIGRKMATAARTAPKGKGVDNTVIYLADKKDIAKISAYLKKMVEEKRAPRYYGRDAENILSASAMLILGTRIKSLGLSPCGNCGFADCAEKNQHPAVPCAFNTGDLGIAIGSAASVAMDNRVDNRIMYTVGIAIREMGLLGDDVPIIYTIPIASASKNPFFDRAG